MYSVRMFAKFLGAKIYTCTLDECVNDYDTFTCIIETLLNFSQGKYAIPNCSYVIKTSTLIEIDSVILIEHVHNLNN